MTESGTRSAKTMLVRLVVLASGVLFGLMAIASGAEAKMITGYSDGQFVFGPRWRPNTAVFPKETSELMDLTGAKMHRFQVQWQDVEPDPPVDTPEGRQHTYEWGRFGAMLQHNGANGIQNLLVINSAPKWAYAPPTNQWGTLCNKRRCNVPPGPEHIHDFRVFIRNALKQFPQVAGIEVWNEPNAPGKWQTRTGPNAKQYTKILCHAYGAVQSIEPTLGRNVPVISGSPHNHGTASRGFVYYEDFLGRAYKLMPKYNNGELCFDGLGMHDYAKKITVPPGDRLFDLLKSFRKIARRGGDRGRGLWVTETGFATRPTRKLSEKEQAKGIKNTLEALEDAKNVKAAFMFTLIEGYTAPGYGQVRRAECADLEACDYDEKKAFCTVGKMLNRNGKNPCGDWDRDGIRNVREVRLKLDFNDPDFDDDGTKDGDDTAKKYPAVAGPQGAAPQIISGPGPNNPTNGANATFDYESDLHFPGTPEAEWTDFECRFLGPGVPSAQTQFSACSPPTSFPIPGEGQYTFEVRAVDQAGTAGLTRSRTFTSDRTAPNTTWIATPPATAPGGNITFQFRSNESGSAFVCRRDGGAWGLCSSPKSYAGLPAGSHTFEVAAIDRATNIDPTPLSHTFTVP